MANTTHVRKYVLQQPKDPFQLLSINEFKLVDNTSNLIFRSHNNVVKKIAFGLTPIFVYSSEQR